MPCPRSESLIASPDFSADAVYNDSSYHCIWVFNCRRPTTKTTVLQFLTFNETNFRLNCDNNFVEIREGSSSTTHGVKGAIWP